MPLPVGSRGVTTGSPADPLDPLDAEDLRDRVHKSLDDLLARQSDVLDGVSDELAPLMDVDRRPAARRQAAAAGLLLLGLARRRR